MSTLGLREGKLKFTGRKGRASQDLTPFVALMSHSSPSLELKGKD